MKFLTILATGTIVTLGALLALPLLVAAWTVGYIVESWNGNT